MTNLEIFLLNNKKFSKEKIECYRIPKSMLRDFKDGSKPATKDWRSYKNPYPYCRDFRIVKFFSKAGNWIGESQSTIVKVEGSDSTFALLYHGLGEQVSLIDKIVVEEDSKARNLMPKYYLKNYELVLIELKGFDDVRVIK